VRREVELLAAAWGISPGEAVGRLVDAYHAAHSQATTGANDGDVPVHRVYGGVLVEGLYHCRTHSLTVTTEPLPGRVFTTPSGARVAVVSVLNPTVAPNGSGWDFWIITASGKLLRTIRHMA
jgi:hypothetical protein